MRDGLTGCPVPHHGGLTLIRHADAGEVCRLESCLGEGVGDDLLGVGPDLVGIVFHPPRPGQDLAMLGLGTCDELASVVNDDKPGTGRSLVYRTDKYQRPVSLSR